MGDFLLVAHVLLILAAVTINFSVDAATFNSFPYLYADSPDSDSSNRNASSWPVQDYIAPQGGGQKRLWNDYPAFLYDPNVEEFRVVEFYVHWCNVCRNLAKHYIHHARKTVQLLEERQDQQRITAATTTATIPQITFHAISCVPNRPLCIHQGITGYPAIRLFKPRATKGTVIQPFELSPISILQRLDINTEGMKEDNEEEDDWHDIPTNRAGTQNDLPWWSFMSNFLRGREPAINDDTPDHHQTYGMKRTRDDLKNDIHLSFDFAMRNGVYMAQDVLSNQAKSALKQWIKLMQDTLPKAWTELHLLLKQLSSNFQYVAKKEAYLLKFLNKYPPPHGDSWSLSCSHGEPGRGYTCGLWSMFHAVTVGVVEHNKVEVQEERLIAPETAARAIRDYVQHFFGCEECRTNFLRMYDRCEFKRCERLKKTSEFTDAHGEQEAEWREVSLWLYEVHNAVNVRLYKEGAAREHRVPKQDNAAGVQWPPTRDCRSCWLEPDNAEGNWQWNETVVSQYLQLEYGHRDSSVAEFQRQLAEANALSANEPPTRVRAVSSSSSSQTTPHGMLLLVCVVGFGLGIRRSVRVARRALLLLHKKERTL